MISLFRVYIPISALMLMFSDAALLLLSISGGPLYQIMQVESPMGGHEVEPFGRLAFVTVNLMLAFGMGLHQRQYVRVPLQTMLRLGASFGLGFLLLSMIFYIAPESRIGMGTLVPAMLVSIIGMAGVRAIYRRMVDIGLFKRRILVVGAGQRALQIEELCERKSANFICIGYLPDESGSVAVTRDRVLPANGPIAKLARISNVTEIVIACESAGTVAQPALSCLSPERRNQSALVGAGADLDVPDEQDAGIGILDDSPFQFALGKEMARELLTCRLHGIRVTDFLSFIEHEKGEVDLDHMHSGWLILGDGFSWASPQQKVAKRLFDIVASCLLLCLASPFLLTAAALILIEDGRPIFYRQERIGLNGRTFKLLKFLSMRVDAEKDGIARWACRNDPRVTRIGSFIRRTRIDEIPQILNVLRGEMSFVGPRPERPVFVANLLRQVPYYGCRHCVKPGITGWAQINFDYGSSVDDARRKLQFDLYYLKNYSIILDLLILIQTVRVVLWPPNR